jgi:hypothetical protein
MSDQQYPVYFDPIRKQLYYIVWTETGNSDIPRRVYIETKKE